MKIDGFKEGEILLTQNGQLIKEYLQKEIGLTEKRACQECVGIQKHPDIESEFILYIQSGWEKVSEAPIVVEGFSAEKLYNQYSLSVVGAYNYLIYLREDPEEALEFLKKGLPRE